MEMPEELKAMVRKVFGPGTYEHSLRSEEEDRWVPYHHPEKIRSRKEIAASSELVYSERKKSRGRKPRI